MIAAEVYAALITLVDLQNVHPDIVTAFCAFINTMQSQNLVYVDTYLSYAVMYFTTTETLPMVMRNMIFTFQ